MSKVKPKMTAYVSPGVKQMVTVRMKALAIESESAYMNYLIRDDLKRSGHLK